jgi:hypothetical protein
MIAAWSAASAGTADARHYRYAGIHPVAKGHPGKYCHIEFPHVHVYAPANARVMYRKHDGWYHFVGDPVAYGYDGETHKYHGAHPIHVDHAVIGLEVEATPVDWCYLKGPHFHAYAPAPQARFVARSGVHFFVGTYPPRFHKHKRRYARINRIYARRKYHRPVVVVEPPAGYVDVLVTAPGVHVHGGAGVRVEVPTPSVDIHVGVGAGLVIGGKHDNGLHRGHYKRRHKKRYRKRRKHKRHKHWKH